MSTTTKTTKASRRVAAGLVAVAAALLPVAAEVGTASPAQATVTVSSTPAEAAAIGWAQSQLGSTSYDGLCQGFVEDAYSAGAGVDIGTAASAIDYWNAHPDLQHAGDLNVPSGALVFWGATDANPYGHVALSEGGDLALSSEERSNYGVHEMSIAERNAAGYQYLGYILPA